MSHHSDCYPCGFDGCHQRQSQSPESKHTTRLSQVRHVPASRPSNEPRSTRSLTPSPLPCAPTNIAHCESPSLPPGHAYPQRRHTQPKMLMTVLTSPPRPVLQAACTSWPCISAPGTINETRPDPSPTTRQLLPFVSLCAWASLARPQSRVWLCCLPTARCARLFTS